MLHSTLAGIRLGRRRVLAGLAAAVVALPFARIVRVNAADFVERDGWILKRGDVEGER